jgi:pentatricopeptide repeat protein
MCHAYVPGVPLKFLELLIHPYSQEIQCVSHAGHGYTAAIHIYGKLKEVSAAEATFEQMRTSHIKPDSAACTALLSAYAAVGAFEKAEHLISLMYAWQVRCTDASYTMLISAYCAVGKWRTALTLLARMEGSMWPDARPSAWTYTVLLTHIARRGTCELAEAAFSLLLTPEEVESTASLPGCEVAREFQELVAESWADRGTPADSRTSTASATLSLLDIEQKSRPVARQPLSAAVRDCSASEFHIRRPSAWAENHPHGVATEGTGAQGSAHDNMQPEQAAQSVSQARQKAVALRKAFQDHIKPAAASWVSEDVMDEQLKSRVNAAAPAAVLDAFPESPVPSFFVGTAEPVGDYVVDKTMPPLLEVSGSDLQGARSRASTAGPAGTSLAHAQTTSMHGVSAGTSAEAMQSRMSQLTSFSSVLDDSDGEDSSLDSPPALRKGAGQASVLLGSDGNVQRVCEDDEGAMLACGACEQGPQRRTWLAPGRVDSVVLHGSPTSFGAAAAALLQDWKRSSEHWEPGWRGPKGSSATDVLGDPLMSSGGSGDFESLLVCNSDGPMEASGMECSAADSSVPATASWERCEPESEDGRVPGTGLGGAVGSGTYKWHGQESEKAALAPRRLPLRAGYPSATDDYAMAFRTPVHPASSGSESSWGMATGLQTGGAAVGSIGTADITAPSWESSGATIGNPAPLVDTTEARIACVGAVEERKAGNADDTLGTAPGSYGGFSVEDANAGTGTAKGSRTFSTSKGRQDLTMVSVEAALDASKESRGNAGIHSSITRNGKVVAEASVDDGRARSSKTRELSLVSGDEGGIVNALQVGGSAWDAKTEVHGAEVLDAEEPRLPCQLDEHVLSTSEAQKLVCELTLQGRIVPQHQNGTATLQKLRRRPSRRAGRCQALFGALALCYMHHNRWQETVAVLGRARALDVQLDEQMVNLAMFACAKAGQHHVVNVLVEFLPNEHRTVGYETLLFALGRRGLHREAEGVIAKMQAFGLPIRDYSVVALIQAYSEAGRWRTALKVQRRLQELGTKCTVHILNALLTVCVRHAQYERGLRVLQSFYVEKGPRRSKATKRLVETLCAREVGVLEMQHALTTAFTVAFAAVGGALVRTGII